MNSKNTSKYIILYESITGGIELLLGMGIFFFGRKVFLFYANLRSEGFLVHSHNVFVMFFRGLLPFFVQYQLAIGLFLITLGLIKFIGSIGLYYQKKWASWLLIASLGLLIPFDIIGSVRHITAIKILYLVINIAIIIYLLPKKIKKEFGKI